MRSRRILLSLLFCFGFDAAVPFELSPRGGYVLEAEDQDEEVVRAERRLAERPADVRQARPTAPPTLAARLVRSLRRSTRVAAETRERGEPPRARTHASDPASPAEDH